MQSEHPDLELIPYARRELAGEDRARVAAHLEGCAGCRDALASHAALVAGLRAEEPPPVDWVRYRAELRGKLDARPRARLRSALASWAPIGATAVAAAAALFLVLRAGSLPNGSGDDLPPFEQVALGSQLDLLQNISVVENLDLLEDLDVVQDLDGGDDGTVEKG